MTKHGLPKQWTDEHVDYAGDDCIAWPFTCSKEGYPRVWHNERMYPAHRLVCEMVNGPPPKDQMDAAHSCGNGHLGCMNPRHLRWATKSENAADRRVHGTALLGEASPRAKLKADEVATIRNLVAVGVKQRALGRHFGISEAQVSRIINGTRWVA